MKRIYHLSTCGTCRKILSEINTEGIDLVNLRETNISKKDLEFLHAKKGSYEALFNKRAQKLKLMSDAEKPKSEEDFKRLILEEYTFMKRPAAILNSNVFVGNDKVTVANLSKALPKNAQQYVR